MANTTLTADVIAKVAAPILENELGVLTTIHRAYEEEFQKSVNGYKVGSTISINRPADFTVRTGAVMDKQDVIEGKIPLVVDTQKGIDFEFTSEEMTMEVDKLGERVIKPAMINLVHNIAEDVFSTMYKGVYNWVGTAGQTVNSFADFGKGPERLDEMSVMQADRHAMLSPADHWGLLGSNSGLFVQGAANDALRQAKLGMLGNVSTWMSQVTPTHTNGAAVDTSAVIDGNSQEVTYDTAKNTWTQTLTTDGWGTSQSLTEGSVFTIADVYMVNPKTKASTGILQQFVVKADVTTNANASNDTDITISPPIITSGPHQTVTYSGNMDGNAINLVGAVSTGYKQNMVYHKNAMALAMAPMELPAGSVQVSRQSYKDISVRVEAVRDGINDLDGWRLDVLYGKKLINPNLATRLSGTS